MDGQQQAAQGKSPISTGLPDLFYSQSDGVLEDSKDVLGVGFAGNDSRPGVNPDHIHGYNNPDAQQVHNIGPLPRGFYTIGDPITHPHLGPLAFPLMPDASNEMFGRSDFWIHGASPKDPLNSSEGCIVMAHSIRLALAEIVAHGFNRLQVTA